MDVRCGFQAAEGGLPGDGRRKLAMKKTIAAFPISVIAVISIAGVCVTGVAYFTGTSVGPISGKWEVVRTWSENDYLTRLNVIEGTEIAIDEHGFLKAGRLGIDGIVGLGACGTRCATLVVNGFDQTYRITLGGKSDGTLILTNHSPAAVVVATKLD